VNVLVLGASGGTGRWIVKDALAGGHVVTAFVRRRPTNGDIPDRCGVAVGDVMDPKSVEAAMVGQDAVVWCVGARARSSSRWLCSEGTANVLQAMQRAGSRLFVCESAFGVGDSRWGGPYARLLRLGLGARVRDKELQEKVVRASGVEWVIVRPTILTNGPRTGKYRIGADLRVGLFPRISRSDVAHFMARQLAEPAFLRQAIAITSDVTGQP
jgi:uncharacterized protein YbjT (DUF2867 family)